jgi:hypothetical protein
MTDGHMTDHDFKTDVLDRLARLESQSNLAIQAQADILLTLTGFLYAIGHHVLLLTEHSRLLGEEGEAILGGAQKVLETTRDSARAIAEKLIASIPQGDRV